MSGDAATWLGVVAIAVPLAAVAAAIPRALWRLDQRRRYETSAGEARTADRAVMLSRVRDKWIAGVLEPSLAHTERLSLDLVRNGHETMHGSATVLQLFLGTGGGLLITGAPGGGKTTLLLELADALLERAESDHSQPVPVVASLATWTPRGARDEPLTMWLADELAHSYRIPAALAHAWASQGDLVLLLDGLDEVAERYRGQCAAALNRFLHDRPFTRMALCCRGDVAGALNPRLLLPETVELRPAGSAQVDAYLARLESTWTPLAEIRRALAADERLRVPLLLKVAALATRGRTPPAARRPDRGARRLRTPEWPQEIAEIFAPAQPEPMPPEQPGGTARFWDAYIDRMLSQRPLTPGQSLDPASAWRWLACLAVRLRDAGDIEFQLDCLASGQLTATRRAPSATDRRVQTVLLDLARWLETRRGARPASWLRDRAGRAYPEAWLRQLPAAMTRPADETGWSPDRVPALAPPVIAALALPAVTVVAVAVGGWVLALPVALACGLLYGLNLPTRFGLVPRPRQPRTVPNESIRRSARQAAVAGLATALGFGVGLVLLGQLLAAPGMTAIVAAAVLAGAGASVSNGAGACGRHYVARLRLARAGVIPWRYKRFLDTMTERTLLHRTGTGYQFIHQLLAEHLINQAGNIANTGPGLANAEVIPVALSYEPAYRADQPPPQRVPHRAQ